MASSRDLQDFSATTAGDVVYVAGEVDLASAAAFMHTVAEVGTPCRIDLRAVTFIDATGVGAVLGACLDSGGVLVGASRSVRRVFEMLDLDEYLPAERVT